MMGLTRFLDPAVTGVWLGRTLILYVVTYLLVWLVALLLARLAPREGDDPIARAHMGWLAPLGLHVLFWISVLVQTLARYQALGLSYWYSGLHLLPVALDAILIIQLTLAMRDRRQRCERLERED